MKGLTIRHVGIDVLEIIQSVEVNEDKADTVTQVFMALTFLAIITINVPIIR